MRGAPPTGGGLQHYTRVHSRGGFLSVAVAAWLGGTAYFYSVASLLVCDLAAYRFRLIQIHLSAYLLK